MPATELPAIPTIADVEAAARRIDGLAVRTPVLRGTAVDELVGAEVAIKCENLQRVGAFKFRGALNAVLSLDDDEAARGVAAHSSGNHAAALALAARLRGVPATLVMPSTVARIKREAVERAGGRVVLCEPTLAARDAVLAEVLADTGAVEIHPYDDPRVIAGAGTAALELFDEVPDLDLVVAPVSGGGLMSGTSIATHGRRPEATLWAAEPAGADDAARSLAAGRRLVDGPRTSVADGLLASLSERTFAVLRAHAVEVVVVDEQQILEATRFLLARVKVVAEPSAGAALAALVARRDELPARVGLLLSGGNVDLERLLCGDTTA